MNLMISFANRYAGSRLAGKEECSRGHFELGIMPQSIVEHDDPQCVQELIDESGWNRIALAFSTLLNPEN